MILNQRFGPVEHKAGSSLKKRSLVDFGKPPVVETSLGILFSPLPEWSIVHYGALWEKFKRTYPKPEYRPFIQPVGEPIPSPQVFADSSKLPIRVCFVEPSNTQLVQIQNGYFLHNWRKTDETPQYQHYANIRPIFVQDWQVFRRFLEESSLQAPDITRCDVTYFNHLVRGEDWEEFAELERIFPAWNGVEAVDPLSKTKMVNFSVWYEQPKGMLQLSVLPGVRQTDGKEVLQFVVTAWAKPNASDDASLFECLDSCHENAVLGFLKFTSEKIQQKWGKR